MLKQVLGLLRSQAVYLAASFLLAGVIFGSTRDFGALLLAVPIMGALLVGALAAAVIAAFKTAQRRTAILSVGLILMTPLAYLCAYDAAQEVRFLLWAPLHAAQLIQASTKDGIITGWDNWGMAGQDTFSYLVADTEDRLGSSRRAEQWTRAVGQTCGIGATQRVWPRLYVVTTFTNCPYDGVAPAGS